MYVLYIFFTKVNSMETFCQIEQNLHTKTIQSDFITTVLLQGQCLFNNMPCGIDVFTYCDCVGYNNKLVIIAGKVRNQGRCCKEVRTI